MKTAGRTSITTLLFLLVGFMAASGQRLAGGAGVPLAHGMMRRILTTSEVVCESELVACAQDGDTCPTCLDLFVATADGCTVDEETCDGAKGFFCCAITDEEEDCKSNGSFTTYLGACTPTSRLSCSYVCTCLRKPGRPGWFSWYPRDPLAVSSRIRVSAKVVSFVAFFVAGGRKR